MVTIVLKQIEESVDMVTIVRLDTEERGLAMVTIVC